MPVPEIFQIPNLLSLSRIFLTPFIGYYLWKGDAESTLICAVLLIVAAMTDGLDGYLARRLGTVGRLGTALDPIADKIFAGVLVVMLVLFRDMPSWLAAIIVGRDLVILAASAVLMRGRRISLPSNVIGQYTFASIAVLLGSYVIRFDFGIALFTWITLAMIAVSLVSYGSIFMMVRKGQQPVSGSSRGSNFGRIPRIIMACLVSAVVLYKLYLFLLVAQ